MVVNTRISNHLNDSRLLNQGTFNHSKISTLCSSADPRFVQPDCQTNPDALAQNCLLPPALLATAPAAPAAAGGINTALLTALVAGGAFLLGAGVFGAYWYTRHREEQRHNSNEHPLQGRNGADIQEAVRE